jgi:hypothetical protein
MPLDLLWELQALPSTKKVAFTQWRPTSTSEKSVWVVHLLIVSTLSTPKQSILIQTV